mmetsp:Transcript_20787/g.43561  ORF Transcript_20787/g.43561 Transcript_20787/m.43561 type:complete len:290 (-) Transcript_20787:956-1825(-)
MHGEIIKGRAVVPKGLGKFFPGVRLVDLTGPQLGKGQGELVVDGRRLVGVVGLLVDLQGSFHRVHDRALLPGREPHDLENDRRVAAAQQRLPAAHAEHQKGGGQLFADHVPGLGVRVALVEVLVGRQELVGGFLEAVFGVFRRRRGVSLGKAGIRPELVRLAQVAPQQGKVAGVPAGPKGVESLGEPEFRRIQQGLGGELRSLVLFLAPPLAVDQQRAEGGQQNLSGFVAGVPEALAQQVEQDHLVSWWVAFLRRHRDGVLKGRDGSAVRHARGHQHLSPLEPQYLFLG